VIRTTPLPKKKVSVKKTVKKVKGPGRGGITKYSEEKKRQILLLMAEGLSDEKVAKVLKISSTTLDNWKKNNPDLLGAIKENKAKWDDEVVKSAKNRAKGFYVPEEKIFCNAMGEVTRVQTQKYYPPDPTAFIFWLTNRQRENWKRNAETGTVSEPITLNMNFGNQNGN